jgi:hypothetical protein
MELLMGFHLNLLGRKLIAVDDINDVKYGKFYTAFLSKLRIHDKVSRIFNQKIQLKFALQVFLKCIKSSA